MERDPDQVIDKIDVCTNIKRRGVSMRMFNDEDILNEGFNWFYRDFIEKHRPDVRIVYGDMRQNPHLPETYVARLMNQFDPVAAQAYVEGKFVNMVDYEFPIGEGRGGWKEIQIR